VSGIPTDILRQCVQSAVRNDLLWAGRELRRLADPEQDSAQFDELERLLVELLDELGPQKIAELLLKDPRS
jgi:hypothetical protein